MRRIIIIAALVAGVTAAVTAVAQTPTETPFPSPKVEGAFVRVATWTSKDSGYLTNFFPQGSEVTFRMFVGDNKTKLSMTDKDLQFAKILVAGQSDVKMTYTGGDPQYPWVGTWKVPADYAPGIVGFQASVKVKKSKAYGSFVQVPVASSQLTITKAG
jgi:hypothetical protein